MKTINILTLFPAFFDGFLGNSIIKRAIAKGAVTFNIYDIREYSLDKNHRVDDRPTGGGAGLVMRLEPLLNCLKGHDLMDTHKILMSPKGHSYQQRDAVRLANLDKDITLICGHYEGIDARFEEYVDEQLSIGDFILTGGEIPASAIADSITRLLPGAIADDSTKEESFGNGLLEYPQYTYPLEYEGKKIPEILFTGDHGKVEEWRLEQALKITAKYRPDLLEKKVWNKKELEAWQKIKDEEEKN